MDTVGQRIRREREAQKVSRDDLARAAGIGVSTLSDLELDRSKSTTKLHRIAEHLRVRVQWLETGKGPKQRDASEAPPDLQHHIETLRFILGAVAVIMTAHRPAEAAALVRQIQLMLPPGYRDDEFVLELVATLSQAGKPHVPERAKPAIARPKKPSARP